jgi:GT2 family glycosyltransferase
MNAPFEPRELARFAWATYGRAEMPGEFFQKIAEERSRSALFVDGPRFNLIAVVESAEGLRRAARTWESLLLQSYPHWRVWGMAPQSVELGLPNDERFTCQRVPEGTPGWKSKNTALEGIADGWVGVIGIGDVLSPAALYQLARATERQPGHAGFYTHEVALRGERLGDFFSKRAWSPWTLAEWNYIGRFWVLRRDHLDAFEPLPDGADEQVALLRAGQRATFGLVPSYLYYGWGSGQWAAPDEPVRQALQSLRATESTDKRPARRISAIICFRDRAEMTLRAVRSLIAHHAGLALDITLVDNDSSPAELAKIEPFLTELPVPTRMVHYPGPFHYNRMHNWAVREHAHGELLLLLNNDVELSECNLGKWAALASEPGIATVGIQLRFDHGGVQHAGIRAWYGGEARVARVGNSHADDALTFKTREVYANTFAACMVRRDAFDVLGGLREKEMVNGFGDVAFCFEAVKQGWHHLYFGGAVGVHRESTSRGKMPYEYWEEVAIEREYPEILQRMLREDLGLNRVPTGEYALGAFLWAALKSKFRRHSRWLDPVKPLLKKGLMRALPAGDSH